MKFYTDGKLRRETKEPKGPVKVPGDVAPSYKLKVGEVSIEEQIDKILSRENVGGSCNRVRHLIKELFKEQRQEIIDEIHSEILKTFVNPSLVQIVEILNNKKEE